MDAGRTAFLRVKRKRCEEPVEALVLACKRFRSNEEQSPASKDLEVAAEKNVFQLVATVCSKVCMWAGMELVGRVSWGSAGVKLYP